MDLGDYGSPGVYVSLMGLKSNSHAIPRVLPEPAKPFLKTVAPNFVPNFQAPRCVNSRGCVIQLDVFLCGEDFLAHIPHLPI